MPALRLRGLQAPTLGLLRAIADAVSLGGQMGTHGRKPGRSPDEPASDRFWRVAVGVRPTGAHVGPRGGVSGRVVGTRRG